MRNRFLLTKEVANCPLFREVGGSLLDTLPGPCFCSWILHRFNHRDLMSGNLWLGRSLNSPKSALLRCVYSIHSWLWLSISKCHRQDLRQKHTKNFWPTPHTLQSGRRKSCPLLQTEVPRCMPTGRALFILIKQAAILIQILLMTFPLLLQKQLSQRCLNSTWTHKTSPTLTNLPCLSPALHQTKSSSARRRDSSPRCL